MALEAEGSNPSIHLDCQILMQICVGIFYNLYIHIRRQQTLNEEFVSAGMAELADAPDLGSGISDVQVQVLLPALKIWLKIRTFRSSCCILCCIAPKSSH